MKKHDLIRIILVSASYLAFLPLSFFLYNGRNGIYYDAYQNSVKLIDSMSVQQTILYAILIGLGLPILLQIGVFFFTPEGKTEKRSALFGLPLSDALCLPYLLTYIGSLLFVVLLSHGKISIATVIAVDLLLLIAHIALILLPSPKDFVIPDPVTASESDSDALSRCCGYLRELAEKTESPAMRDAMLELAGLLDTVDPTLSSEIDALESKLSAQCIEIENAILGGNSSKITILTRELIDLSESVRSRIAAASLTVRGERFDQTDNEIAEGLIDKILDEMDVEDEADIVNRDRPLDTDLRFIKALRFADDEYREILQGYNQTIRQRLLQNQEAEQIRRVSSHKRIRSLTYLCFGLIGIAIAAIFSIRAFVTQPGGFLYKERGDGTLSIIGYNQMYGEKAVIPAEIHGTPVSMVGKYAFRNQYGVTEIVVSEGIRYIDIHAFRGAGNLKTIYLPASLTDIYGYVFYEDSYLSIYYASDEESWNDILQQQGNSSALKTSTVHFNSSYKD